MICPLLVCILEMRQYSPPAPGMDARAIGGAGAVEIEVLTSIMCLAYPNATHRHTSSMVQATKFCPLKASIILIFPAEQGMDPLLVACIIMPVCLLTVRRVQPGWQGYRGGLQLHLFIHSALPTECTDGTRYQ